MCRIHLYLGCNNVVSLYNDGLVSDSYRNTALMRLLMDYLMRRQGIRLTGVAVLTACLCCGAAATETFRLAKDQQWQSVVANPQAEYLHALAELNDLIRAGDTDQAKAALKGLKEDYPQRVGPDLDQFVDAELDYWKDKFDKAAPKYEKMLKDFPGSEYAATANERLFDIAKAYLNGRKRTVLWILRLSGTAEGIKLMENISDRVGMQEPNSVGLKAAIEVAEYHEAHEEYLEAYTTWSEIASYWEKGPVAKRAVYRMAEDNYLAYDQNPPKRRAFFDASKLVTAKTYYEKYSTLYPQDANSLDIPEKLKQIDEKVAFKQYTIGKYYIRAGKQQAAHLYFDMVVRNWPKTEAAEMARQALDEDPYEESQAGKGK
jgi:tetratricopeptide (TPR) repeat protein